MLELDECNQLLVTNPFADDISASSSRNNHDILDTLTFDSSSQHHPLRGQSVSLENRCNTPNIPVASSESETRPRLMSVQCLDSYSTATAEKNLIAGTASQAYRDGSDTIIHSVGPNDSFAGVALRYGISIAALRRANQLWPSDPIHLRTELLIPRGDVLRQRHKLNHNTRMDSSRSAVELTPDLPPDLISFSFTSARNKILSVLPARISLDSLSSKASTSEDHEMDDLRRARAHKMSAIGTPFPQDGHELSSLATSQAQYKLPTGGVAPSSQVSSSPSRYHHTDSNHINPVGYLRSQSISSSSSVSFKRPSQSQPFVVVPVRTSQLEPEPAMELSVRRSRI